MGRRTLFEEASGSLTDRKSRFIARVVPVSSEEEALAVLQEEKKKYYDARHHCFAYIVGEEKETVRSGVSEADGLFSFICTSKSAVTGYCSGACRP